MRSTVSWTLFAMAASSASGIAPSRRADMLIRSEARGAWEIVGLLIDARRRLLTLPRCHPAATVPPSLLLLGPGKINGEGLLAVSVNNHGAFVWSIAELLRGDDKQPGHQEVVLPLVVIRRLDEVSQMRGDRVEYVTETREYVSSVGVANSAAELHPSGTVVLSRTASAGFSAIMGDQMATSQDFVTWTCGAGLEPRFLLLCLRAMRRDLLERLAQGSTHKTIYMPDIISIAIPVRPTEEQRTIVERFWSRAKPLEATIDALNRQLPLLAEYREALIAAAVTGEIAVDTFDSDRHAEATA